MWTACCPSTESHLQLPLRDRLPVNCLEPPVLLHVVRSVLKNRKHNCVASGMSEHFLDSALKTGLDTEPPLYEAAFVLFRRMSFYFFEIDFESIFYRPQLLSNRFQIPPPKKTDILQKRRKRQEGFVKWTISKKWSSCFWSLNDEVTSV